jgi:hypothetical protein
MQVPRLFKVVLDILRIKFILVGEHRSGYVDAIRINFYKELSLLDILSQQ